MSSRRTFRILPKAAEDIRNLLAYSEKNWGGVRFHAYVRDLEKALHEIQDNPEIGVERLDLDDDMRSFPSGKHMILYYVFADSVEIARVLHQRMDVRRFAD